MLTRAEAEAVVIGHHLWTGGRDLPRARCGRDDFTPPRREVYDAILGVHRRDEQTDIITVHAELCRRGAKVSRLQLVDPLLFVNEASVATLEEAERLLCDVCRRMLLDSVGRVAILAAADRATDVRAKCLELADELRKVAVECDGGTQ